jgi:signal transduction histidine kinase
MEWFGILGWIVAAALGALAWALASRKPAAPAAGGQAGDTGSASAPPIASEAAPPTLGTEEEALRQALGFLDRAVLPPLREARRHLGSGPAVEPLERALDAMGDLAFFAEPLPDEAFTQENLAALVQESVREYTIETRIPVRVHAPSHAVHVRVRRESLKDAVFLLLANAGRFSEGRPVDVYIEEVEPSGFRIRIADEGPGFTPEALERALEPFWSTDPVGVGMGLPQARARVSEMKGRLALRNQESAGAEVTLEFPDRDAGPAA